MQMKMQHVFISSLFADLTFKKIEFSFTKVMKLHFFHFKPSNKSQNIRFSIVYFNWDGCKLVDNLSIQESNR
jgi:hypothetical protein